MTSKLFTIASFALAVAIGPVATRAQVPAGATRSATPPAAGTADLTVIVSTDEPQSQPIRRASVAIQAGELDVPRIGVTDDEGRVAFLNLKAGNYLLTASKSGYVRTFYGAALPGRGPGVAVTVLDGQHVSGISIRMLRGSVLTGVIRSASGRPAPYQQVQAIMVRSANGEKRAINVEGSLGMVTTDDRGVYRIFGLAPGDYLVSVPAIGLSRQDVREITAAELQWADGAVAAAAGQMPVQAVPAPANGPTLAYSPVYYPGTTVVTDAAVVTLGPSEERGGVDFGLQLVPTALVKGRVVDAEGRPQGGVSVSIRPARSDGLDLFASLLNGTARTNPDGTFTLSSVKPGSYTLSARATPRAGTEPAAPPDPAEAARQAVAAIMGGGAGFSHWAEEDVSVLGRDVADVTLTLRPGMRVTGKIVYDAATKTPPADLSKTALSLMSAPTGMAPADLVNSLIGGGSTAAKVAADGTFTIEGVSPGRYRLNSPFGMVGSPMAGALTGGWTLKSVMAGGRDIADAPIDIRSGADVTDVVVTFTDRPTELSGTVRDAAGRVTPDFPIVVFSTDRGYWTPASRRVQTARPSSDGTFRVSGLPAGEYFVSAVTAVDRAEVYDPAFLEQLVPLAFKITIADGEKKTQDLRLGGG